jgi:hypothetical protein
MRSVTRQEIYGKAKVGTVAGLVGGFALFVSFFGIDSQLSAEPGTFYMMIGLAVGLHGMSATIFGFIAHMLTAATIGAVFCVCSLLHPMLNLRTIWKGIFAGGITGLEVYAIFFMPITLFLIMPTIDTSSSTMTSDELAVVAVIKSHITMIMWGALVLHILYGTIMGLFSGMVIREDYNKIPKKTAFDLESESMPAT